MRNNKDNIEVKKIKRFICPISIRKKIGARTY